MKLHKVLPIAHGFSCLPASFCLSKIFIPQSQIVLHVTEEWGVCVCVCAYARAFVYRRAHTENALLARLKTTQQIVSY